MCFVTFLCGVLGRVLYLIVCIPNLCLLTYFEKSQQTTKKDESYPGGKELLNNSYFKVLTLCILGNFASSLPTTDFFQN